MALFSCIMVVLASLAACAAEPTFSDNQSASGTFDTIAGDLPPVLMAKKRPYYVAGDIYVPQGKTVTISAGAVFCFKNFTSLHIQGTLLAKGEKETPIIFTSDNDKDYNKQSTVEAAPYDWNGIYIHEEGIGTVFSYCAVMYSVDGISALTKFFKLAPCVFLHNGRANLTIENTPQPVTDQPYEYSLSINDVPAGPSAFASLKDPFVVSRKTFRYSGYASSVIGGIGILGFSVHLGSTQKTFSSISGTDKQNLAANSGQAWTNARTNRNSDVAGLLSSVGVAIIGAVGILWSFHF